MAICNKHDQTYDPKIGEFCPYCGNPKEKSGEPTSIPTHDKTNPWLPNPHYDPPYAPFVPYCTLLAEDQPSATAREVVCGHLSGHSCDNHACRSCYKTPTDGAGLEEEKALEI
jgi:hypothetical protein